MNLSLQVSHGGLLPIAPLTLLVQTTADAEPTTLRLKDVAGKTQTLTMPFHASHVGVCTPGIKACVVEDLFGLFVITKVPTLSMEELLVLPDTFDVEDLQYAAGDSGLETMARATEDVTNPSDVRGYQPGDAMKKIHWKLSARKRELMVRRFDEPVLSEVLVLMDCSAPPSFAHAEAEADLKDALLESAASVATEQVRQGHPVRLPIYGQHPMEFENSMGVPALLENLARCDFSETDRFERILRLETRRMRKVGATVVLAARLNSHMVDMMIRMKRMGPYVRFYLTTFTPEEPTLQSLVSKLEQGGVEVRLVKPTVA